MSKSIGSNSTPYQVLLGVALLSFGFSLSSCKWRESKLEPKAETPPKPFVTAFRANTQEIFHLSYYPARVTSEVESAIPSEIDGVVSALHVRLGQRVSKGQKLAELSHTDPIYHYAPLMVMAPVDGMVSSILVSQGSYVARAGALLGVTDPDRIRLEIEVPAGDLPSLSNGMKGEFQIQGHRVPLDVKIGDFSPSIDRVTGTSTVRLKIDSKYIPPNSRLVLGTLGKVSFKSDLHQGILIPLSAIMYRADDTWARKLEDRKVKAVKINVGKKQRGFAEILDGINTGDVIIDRTSRFLGDGEEVQIENEKDVFPEVEIGKVKRGLVQEAGKARPKIKAVSREK